MERLPILLVALVFITVASAGDYTGGKWEWAAAPTTAACSGSMAECMQGEFEMDSEINRRILATTKYISYGALQRNNVPCSLRGASYYNCKTGAQANPYTRGCSTISRCRS